MMIYVSISNKLQVDQFDWHAETCSIYSYNYDEYIL